ncbi:phage tail protein [Hymenobacter daeguensis]
MKTPFTPASTVPPASFAVPQPAAAPPTRRSWLKGLGALVAGLFLSRAAKAKVASPQQVLGGTPYLGEIQLFAFGFAPRGWALCEGQILPIAQNAALFSLLGTTYGGNGQTTFALPDMRGRTPRGVDSSSGNYQLGQRGGGENITLTTAQLPAHTHGYLVSNAAATSNVPAGTAAAVASASNDLNGEAVNMLAYAATPTVAEAATAITATGGATSLNILAPYETLSFCIALQGIFPSRN